MNLMWTALLMGLMGSFHCAGMCGPIALSIPGRNEPSKSRFLLGRLSYNSGRIITYTLLGIILGIIGFSLHFAGLQQALSIFSGVSILALQFSSGLSGKIAGIFHLQKKVSAIKKTFSGFMKKRSIGALFTIGILNGILPCGMVYLALAGALSAGTLKESGLYMFLFGVGTLPVMLFISLSGKIIDLKKFQKIVPWVIAIIAILFILRGLNLGIPYLSPHLNIHNEVKGCH